MSQTRALFTSAERDKDFKSMNWPIHHKAPDIVSLLRDAPVPKAVVVMYSLLRARVGGRHWYYNIIFRKDFHAYYCLLNTCLESQEPVKGAEKTLPQFGNSTLLLEM